MTLAVFYKLLAIMGTIGLGWLALRRGWFARDGAGGDAAQVLGNAALYVFVPALLFRTMVRQDLAALPLRTLAAYFAPALIYMLMVYGWYRSRQLQPGAEPATRAIAACYGNGVQLGIPMAAALFGEAGLALHIALISLHGLVLLTVLTVLVEADLARKEADGNATSSRWNTLQTTVRNTITHPVVMPVLAGLAWNLTGLGLHPVADQLLQTLGLAVAPLSLVLIGASLATYGVQGHLRSAWGVAVLKLLVMPTVVLLVAHYGFGLQGQPLAVLVMMAALPAGSNALIFAQRYKTLQAQASVSIVVSTLAFMGTAALWLAVLGWVG